MAASTITRGASFAGRGRSISTPRPDYITHLVYRGLAAHPPQQQAQAPMLALIDERLSRIERKLGVTE
jgi:hypothetical protein